MLLTVLVVVYAALYASPYFLVYQNFTCFTVKSRSIVSLMTLIKHSTSSDVPDLGCSGFPSFCRRRHSRLSILVVTATSVSFVNPLILSIGLLSKWGNK